MEKRDCIQGLFVILKRSPSRHLDTFSPRLPAVISSDREAIHTELQRCTKVDSFTRVRNDGKNVWETPSNWHNLRQLHPYFILDFSWKIIITSIKKPEFIR